MLSPKPASKPKKSAGGDGGAAPAADDGAAGGISADAAVAAAAANDAARRRSILVNEAVAVATNALSFTDEFVNEKRIEIASFNPINEAQAY
jgi:hypothetical protein